MNHLDLINAFAPPAFVDVGSCIDFAVVAGATITNSGFTVLNGDLGLSPGTAVTGFPVGEVVGTVHVTDSAASSCMADLALAITDANGRPADATMNGELGGMTLPPGVYKSDGGFAITNTLYLDGQNDPEAAWIFIMATTLSVNTGAAVVMLNYDYENTTGINVWWSCGERADIFVGAAMQGTVMAKQSIAAQNGASTGPLMANIGQVTLLTNVVNSYPFVLNVTVPITPEPTAQPSVAPTNSPNRATSSSSGSAVGSDGVTAGIVIGAVAFTVLLVGVLGVAYFGSAIASSAGGEAVAVSAPASSIAMSPV